MRRPFSARKWAETDGKGFDDIVILAPTAQRHRAGN